MTIRYTIEERDRYLLFTGEGTEGDLKSNIEIHQMIVNACKNSNCRHVLIDDRKVIYTASLFSLYELAKYYSEVDVPRFILRAAILVNSLSEADHRFFEDVMQNHNINLRVFYDITEAEKWLTT